MERSNTKQQTPFSFSATKAKDQVELHLETLKLLVKYVSPSNEGRHIVLV
jgi:hypothetical protein